MLSKKIDDKPFLRLIRKWLKAGIFEKDKVVNPVLGTPQGALCKALHKPPYAKLAVMQSNHKISCKFNNST